MRIWFFSFFMLLCKVGFTQSIPLVQSSDPQCIISFIFDDLNASDSVVKQIFDEYGFQPSFALTTNKLNHQNVRLYKTFSDEGISILAHSHSHPKMNVYDETLKDSIRKEIEISKRIITDFGIPVFGFVTPSSQMDQQYLPLLDSIYDYAFTNNNNAVFDRSVEKHHLARYGIEANISKEDHSLSTIIERIDLAIEKKELLVLYGHTLPSRYLDDQGSPRVNASDLQALLGYIQQKAASRQCRVLTADKAIAFYYRP
ncbi:MAG: polysaccharide deacetylase family protein [Saprospiraceae bacterium]|nr:polysaccharide deacetylase family protein [Saprospiraceae bacterium]